MADMTLEEFADWADGKARLLQRLDLKPVLQEILADLTEGLAGCFNSSHDPDGQAWPQLQVPFRRPLWGTRGRMIQRVLTAHQQAAVGPLGFTVQVDSEVAALHNFALQKRPLREFLGFGERELDRAETLIAERVSEAILKD